MVQHNQQQRKRMRLWRVDVRWQRWGVAAQVVLHQRRSLISKRMF
jgi:hypothetical protein